MEIALIGLGRMGHNMAKRLLGRGHDLVVYDRSEAARAELVQCGARAASSLSQLIHMLTPPRAVWIMVPHDVVNSVIAELVALGEKGDIIIDGGNSHFLESIERSAELARKGLHFLDVGVSGGIFGLERGYCLMIGGDKKIAADLDPIFSALAPGEEAAPKTFSRGTTSSADQGYLYCGPSGSGHFVKMIHNAIEYGMMQSYAEGLELLENASLAQLPENQRFDFDISEIVELWRRGSVIGSWLLDLVANALQKDKGLNNFSGIVPDSGEGRWALIEAIKQNTPAPNLANALFTRFRSRQNRPYAERTLSALRQEFGGHQEGAPPQDQLKTPK